MTKPHIPPQDSSHPHPEVTDPAQALSPTDTGLARVLEDLIDVLISKGLIQFTDLPESAQRKLLERRSTRAILAHPLTLLPGDHSHDHDHDHGVL